MMRRFIAVAAAAASLAIAAPAVADGNVVCAAGPRDSWQPLSEVRKKAWLERWTVQEARVQGDCYEVYARTESGQAIEAFFHPVTLEKLVVFRRGREIYRKAGFTG